MNEYTKAKIYADPKVVKKNPHGFSLNRKTSFVKYCLIHNAMYVEKQEQIKTVRLIYI